MSLASDDVAELTATDRPVVAERGATTTVVMTGGGATSCAPWLRAHRRRHRRTRLVLAGLDLAAIVVSLVLSLGLAELVGPWAEGGIRRAVIVGGLCLPVWMAALVQSRLYQARFIATRAGEYRRIVRAAGAGAIGMVIANAALGGANLRRAWILAAAVTTVMALVAEREVVRRRFGRLRATRRAARRVVIVGANAEAAALRGAMDADPALGAEFAGYLSVGGASSPSTAADTLGPVDDALAILERVEASHVLVAGSAADLETTKRLARRLLAAGYHLEVSPTLPDIDPERLTLRSFGRFPLMYLEAQHQEGWRAVAKRAFDLAAASVGLVVAAPAMAAVALAVRLDSPGPVLYRQRRVGRRGEPFDVLKFRSMVPDAHQRRSELVARNEADGPLFKIADDPRITRVGRFIRKTSLDELPQLWNVVRGDMSLVGPRPALPEEVAQWAPELHDRLRVQPGITGMWQVSGRSSCSFEDYTRLDLYYVDNWSLARDLEILLRTVPAVLASRGAS
ncbi:MAG: sugar transferase [Actinomycetota bacterium]|nr:sugar transferase [Actinomycetota bacterium]